MFKDILQIYPKVKDNSKSVLHFGIYFKEKFLLWNGWDKF